MFLYQSPTPPKTTIVFRGRANLPQARSTIDFVGKRLPPVNSEIYKSIKSNLASKQDFNRARLIEDVKSDPFILLNSTKRLPSIIDQPQRYIDPILALQDIEQEKLEELFRNPFPSSHEHRLDKMTKQQALTLKLTIACAKYAEALSQKSNTTPSIAFASALFRQLGLNLIAWNYPSVYSSALARHRSKGEDLNNELEKLLGISPRKLGARLLQEWSIKVPSQEQDNQAKDNLIDLAEICALCEDPENFPEAKNRFAEREEEIKKLLDSDTIDKIKDSINENISRFAKISPIVNKVTRKTLTKEPLSPLFLSDIILQRNPLLSKTSSEIKIAFQEVYSKLLNRTFSPEAVKLLVEKVVPSIGFEHGCLYLTNKKSPLYLDAALRFGNIPLSAYTKFLDTTNNMIKESVDTLTPCRADGLGISGNISTYITAGFTHIRHEGVLYLEMANDLREDPTFEATLIFQIIRQALKDAFIGA